MFLEVRNSFPLGSMDLDVEFNDLEAMERTSVRD